MSKSANSTATPAAATKSRVITVTTTNETFTEGAGSTIMHFNVIGQPVIDVDVSVLSDEIRNRAILHGLNAKIIDVAALGKDATPADKHAAMVATVERLIAGDWNKARGDGSAPVAGLIFRAYTEVMQTLAAKAGKTVTPEQLRAKYEAKDRAGQLALRTNPEIAVVIERLKSERNKVDSVINTKALLADLDID